MRASLDREIATLRIGVELTRKRALNVAGPRVMPFDEIAV
jgi:hypothetical protein